MPDYQHEIKQIVDYPRCRIHREFIQSLIADRSIRTNNGCSGLFYYAVLCSYANFRTSYRRLDGITYTVYPGEWVCTLKELAEWLRIRTKRHVLDILEDLQYASNDTSTGEYNDLGVFYTDEDGRIELTDPDISLRDGWFRVKELEPAPGFSIADPDTQEAFIAAGEGHTFRFYNRPLSAICVSICTTTHSFLG